SIIPLLFLNATATTDLYTLSLHDALPISPWCSCGGSPCAAGSSRPTRTPGCRLRSSSTLRGTHRVRIFRWCRSCATAGSRSRWRSEEHTSELQSRFDLVCRLLLEKKKEII